MTSGSGLGRAHVWLPKAGASRTLLLLHGSGADEYDLLPLAEAIDPNANVLSPRGQMIQDGMTRFFEYNADFSPKEETLLLSVNELADFIQAASKQYGFDLGKLVAIGFSNGAHTAGGLLTVHPELVEGIVAFGTTRAFNELNFSPDLSGKFVFVANGEQDPYSPPLQTDLMVAEFQGWGARVEVLMHPGGHQISGEHLEIIAQELAFS
jgi:phospholipase/carboxylesterase